MADRTFTVTELFGVIDQAIATSIPGPVWVRGEVTGLRRTSGGAVFFRLADPEIDDRSLEVSARGRVMFEIDRQLAGAGIGPIRDGVELRARGTVAVDQRQSRIRLTLLEVDPAFTAGRLALQRVEVLRKLSTEGILEANRRLPIPLVPQRVGLVTSRGSAAHADFIDHLERSGLRFAVKTAHTNVQGETAPETVAAAIDRAGAAGVDVIALIRGGGSKLDLAVFDSETVGRAIAAAPVPVITGIGHEIDRTVADEAAAIYQKTPTAASEWLVTAVADFANRVSGARQHIEIQARSTFQRLNNELRGLAVSLKGIGGMLERQGLGLGHLSAGVKEAARSLVLDEQRRLDSLAEWFATVGVDQTLKRGFALIMTPDGKVVVRSRAQLGPGDRVSIRFADGTVPVIVDES